MCVCVCGGGGGGVHILVFDTALYNFGSKTEALICDGFAKTQTHEDSKERLFLMTQTTRSTYHSLIHVYIM